MSRVPMVTRTLTTTQATAMCLNIETAEPFNKTFTLPRTYPDKEKLLKKVKEIGDTDTEKVVAIVDQTEVETLYGMREEEFVKYATILPPRSGSADANADAEADADTEN